MPQQSRPKNNAADGEMQSIVVILGTGGTIAGQAARADDVLGYSAGTLGVDALIAAVPPLAGRSLEAEQVAQLDSKDMDHATWQRLARRAVNEVDVDEIAVGTGPALAPVGDGWPGNAGGRVDGLEMAARQPRRRTVGHGGIGAAAGRTIRFSDA